jgi:Mor family transcriptional regulator
MGMHHLRYALSKMRDDDILTVRQVRKLIARRKGGDIEKMEYVHGEKHYKSKLNEDDVRTIRKRAAEDDSWGSRRRLAEEYEVHETTILAIINRTSWKHVD